jgi:hypothetical protein
LLQGFPDFRVRNPLVSGEKRKASGNLPVSAYIHALHKCVNLIPEIAFNYYHTFLIKIKKYRFYIIL